MTGKQWQGASAERICYREGHRSSVIAEQLRRQDSLGLSAVGATGVHSDGFTEEVVRYYTCPGTIMEATAAVKAVDGGTKNYDTNLRGRQPDIINFAGRIIRSFTTATVVTNLEVGAV